MPIIGHVLHPDQPLAASPKLSGPAAVRAGWITPALIADTIATWQPYYIQTLTDDDAIEMLLTVGNLYRVLAGDTDDHEQLHQTEN